MCVIRNGLKSELLFKIFLMKKWFYLLGILFSCTTPAKKLVFPEEKLLKADTVSTQDVLYGDFITKRGDYLFVTSSRSPRHMIYMYSTPDLKLVKKFGAKGKGPDEMVLPMLVEGNTDDLYLWGYPNMRLIKQLSVDSLGEIRTVREYELPVYETFNRMHLIKDSVFVYMIPDECVIKRYDCTNKKELPRLQFNAEGIRTIGRSMDQGVMLVNDSLIIYAYEYKKQIDFYDFNTLELKKSLVGDYTPQQLVENYKDNVEHYLNIVRGKKYFYVTYQGKTNREQGDKPIMMEVFDYAGNPVIKYSFDRDPGAFTVDEENQILYGYNSRYPDVLLKYQL